jgi:hypothetical protein
MPSSLPDDAPARSFASFREFYPVYLAEHANRTSRRLHFLGTCLVIVLALFALATGAWGYLVLVPVVGYGFAWIGHLVFEKNRPATFKHPLYSLMGDFAMAWDIARGKIAF